MFSERQLRVLRTKMFDVPSVSVSYIPTDNHSAPPDVTTGLVEHLHHERPQVASVRGIPRGYNSSILETADGEYVKMIPLSNPDHFSASLNRHRTQTMFAMVPDLHMPCTVILLFIQCQQ